MSVRLRDRLADRWRQFVHRRHRIDQVPGVKSRWPSQWVEALQKAYPNQDHLQQVLDRGNDAHVNSADDAIERVLVAIAGPIPTGIPEPSHEDVAWLLGTSLVQTGRRLTARSLLRHLADMLVLLGVAVLVGLPLGGLPFLARWQASRDQARAAEARRSPHFEAAHDLLPYVPLAAGDLAEKGETTAGARLPVAGLIGHYPLHEVAAGKTVGPDEVSKNKTSLTHFSVLRVTLKTTPAFDTHAFPIAVDLALSARGTPPSGTMLKAELFHLASNGLDAIVAIPDAAMSDAAQLLGNADAYVALPCGVATGP